MRRSFHFSTHTAETLMLGLECWVVARDLSYCVGALLQELKRHLVLSAPRSL